MIIDCDKDEYINIKKYVYLELVKANIEKDISNIVNSINDVEFKARKENKHIDQVLREMNRIFVFPDDLAINIFMKLQTVFWNYLDNYAFKRIKEGYSAYEFECNCMHFIKFCFYNFHMFKSLKIYFYKMHDTAKFNLDSIPSAGCFLVNKEKTKILFIRSKYGKFDFPKGKVENNETPMECAIRETWEEVGFDCKNLISEDKKIEIIVPIKHIKRHSVKKITMYIIHDVDENYPFKYTLDQAEVEIIKWVNIDEISTDQKDKDRHISFVFKKEWNNCVNKILNTK